MFKNLEEHLLGALGNPSPLGGIFPVQISTSPGYRAGVPNPPPRTATDHEELLREMMRNAKPVPRPPTFPSRTVRAEDAARWYDTLRVMTRVPLGDLERGGGLKWRAPMRCIATYPPAPTFREFCIAYNLTLVLEDGGRWTPEL